jgi:hypothetical protein
VDSEDVRVGKRGHSLGFALEARPPVRIVGARFRQDFDGHFASQAGVASAVHLAHAAGAERGHNLIRAKAG